MGHPDDEKIQIKIAEKNQWQRPILNSSYGFPCMLKAEQSKIVPLERSLPDE